MKHTFSSAQIASFGFYSGAFVSLATATKFIDGGVQQSLETSSNGSLFGLFFVGSISTLWTLISSALALLLTAKVLNFQSNVGIRDFALVCIETLRSIAAVTIRLPLFVIPALYEWLRLTPVPFVVLFHTPYREGRVDALVAARDFFRKFPCRVTLLTLLTVLFSVGTALLETPSSGDLLPIWEMPQQHIVSILVLAAAQFVVNWLLLKIYLRAFTQLTAQPVPMSNKS